MSARPFTFYKRGRTFYVRFRSEDGVRLPAVSTGCTSRAAAESWAVDFLRKRKARGRGTVAGFLDDFFLPDVCKWTMRQRSPGYASRPPTDSTLTMRRGHVKNWILPALGSRPLAAVRKAELEDFLAALPLSVYTRNNMRDTLRIVFREAEDRGLVTASPAERIRLLHETEKKKRPVFATEELRALFPPDRQALLSIWGGAEAAAVFVVLAACGLRSGEVRALAWRHVLDGALVVERAVKAGGRNRIGPTKTGKVRVVPLPRRAEAILADWRAESPWTEPEDFCFPSPAREAPINLHFLQGRLRAALGRAGIPEAGRTPHSFRWGVNTSLRGHVDGEVLRALTGHSGANMTEHYDAPTVAQLLARVQAARPVLDKLWSE